MISDAELRARYPEIPWGEPVQVHVLGKPAGRWVCRYCIATHGLTAARIDATPYAFSTRLEARTHVQANHE